MILVVDNYDSFTFNLVQILKKNNYAVKVIKNDEWNTEQLLEQTSMIDSFLISPGPGHPSQAKLSRFIVEKFHSTHPILGVCLGHQVIAEVFGAKICHAIKPMHGKLSSVVHDRSGSFYDLPSAIKVVRYHSLVVDQATLPQSLRAHAFSLNAQGEQEEIMGLRHEQWHVEGWQFHPESILTEYGEQLVLQFFERHQTPKSAKELKLFPS
jgi:anthranilate synthase/aminodeoxychorismate synthase-like glutamine amidotransferase